MKQPVLILSDLHLGHSASVIDDITALEPLIAGAGTLIINGDAWQELANDFRVVGKKLLDDLHTMCSARGIDLVLIQGNHDPETGQVGYMPLAGGKIILTHGDCVFPEGAPWSRMVSKRKKELRQIFSTTNIVTIEDRLALAKKVAQLLIPPTYPKSRNRLLRIWDAVTPPSRALRMIISWLCMVSETRKFRNRFFPQCEILVCGHFHRAGIWDEKNLLVINTGSFMPPGGAYWCEWNEGLFTVGMVKKSESAFARGEILGVWKIP